MPPLVIAVLCYFAGVSLLAVILTAADKRRAKKHLWRIPEATLLLVSALGGSVAMYLTMRAIRHKTRKAKYMVGIPVIAILQAALGGLVWLKRSGIV